MMVLASVLAALFNLAGLAFAWMLDLPPGAVIILIAAICYLISLIIEKVRSGSS
ncbi:MAG: metal ABC transporter permease [Candidatus Fermentibacteria bacterium]